MAKKNFKGGLDSLIENSLGMRKSSKKGELKGNPIDLVQPEQTDDSDKDEDAILGSSSTKKKENQEAAKNPQPAAKQNPAPETKKTIEEAPVAETQEPEPQENKAQNNPEPPKDIKTEEAPNTEGTAKQQEIEPSAEADNAESNTAPVSENPENNANSAYLMAIISDLKRELALWRTGKITVQSFNSTLQSHGLRYNQTTNELEEI
ncbi:MAG: hypothetical protein MJZ61_02500 [Bacteroidales bacterium]|nr:hypothetical protein [Bacteroidales bacterium]